MERHFLLKDSEFLRQFENCELCPSDFSHEAHLRLGWIHIRLYGIDRAEKNVTAQLQNFVKYAKAEDKYHETVTITGLRTINYFMKKSNCATFMEFIKEFPQLKYNFKDLINSHYKNDVFSSPIAKSQYIKPDLNPLYS
jgi:hypothetical protein